MIINRDNRCAICKKRIWFFQKSVARWSYSEHQLGLVTGYINAHNKTYHDKCLMRGESMTRLEYLEQATGRSDSNIIRGHEEADDHFKAIVDATVNMFTQLDSESE